MIDHTASNNTKLFDDLLAVLNRHAQEPGVLILLEDLQSAKLNYAQRSIDHMMNCLVLVIHDLVAHPPSEELSTELKLVIHRFYTGIFEAPARLSEMAHCYESSGGTLLSADEILREVDDRRGASR